MWWAVLEMQGRAGQGGLAAREEGVECVFDTMWNAYRQARKCGWGMNEGQVHGVAQLTVAVHTATLDDVSSQEERDSGKCGGSGGVGGMGGYHGLSLTVSGMQATNTFYLHTMARGRSGLTSTCLRMRSEAIWILASSSGVKSTVCGLALPAHSQ